VESLNAQLGQLTDTGEHGRTADQTPRWGARVWGRIEPHVRRINGSRQLPLVHVARQTESGRTEKSKGVAVA
jgi:hypothetical protein